MFSFTPSVSFIVTTDLSPARINEVLDALINTAPDRWNGNWNYMGNMDEFRIDQTVFSGRGNNAQIVALGSIKSEEAATTIQIDYEYANPFTNIFLWCYAVITSFITLFATLVAVINMFAGRFTFCLRHFFLAYHSCFGRECRHKFLAFTKSCSWACGMQQLPDNAPFPANN